MQVIIAHGTLSSSKSNSIEKYLPGTGKPEHLDYIFTDKDDKQPKDC